MRGTRGPRRGDVTETARYLYAISRGVDRTALEGVRGIDGAPLDIVAHHDLAAVVSDVDLAEYGEEGLRRNLERLDWLEAVARAHDAVVQTVAQSAPTAPLRLATICLDDSGVRRRLDEWHDELELVLDRVDGRMEWSVKVLAPPRANDEVPESSPTPPRLTGAAYLKAKKEANQARLSADESAQQTVQQLHAALASRCVASRQLPPQDPRLTGVQATMLLNAAYLVAAEDQTEFVRQVDDLAAGHPHLLIECRGPWPPYSFAVLEQS